jgi:hypothetical protein
MAEKLEIVIGAKDQFSGAFGKLRSALPSVRTLALGASAAIAGLGASLLATAKSTATAYDEVQKFSDQLGVSTKFLSAMSHAADLSGIQINVMRKSIQALQVRIGEAGRGVGEAKDAFEDLGVALRTTTGQLKTAEQLLPELAQAFKETENATLRAEAASKIFGQRGIAMLQMFKDGSAGLAEMTAEAERFGLVVSAKAGQAAAQFNDSLTRLTGSMRGLKNTIGEQLLPVFAAIFEVTAEWIAQNREMIAMNVQGWLSEVAQMALAVAQALIWIDENITEKILDFFFGPANITALEVKQQELETTKRQLELAKRYLALDLKTATNEQIEETKKLIEFKKEAVDILEREIEALGKQKEAQDESTISIDTFIERIKEKMAELKAAIAEVSGGEDGEVPGALTLITADSVSLQQEYMDELSEAALFFWTKNEKTMLQYYDALQKERDREIKQEKKQKKALLKGGEQFFSGMAQLSGLFGKKAFRLTQALAIGEATMRAIQAFNVNLAAYAYPLGPILGALALATGLAQVAQIAAQSPPSAHGGLESVPREQTYLLAAGERILSPQQNTDLTRFLESAETTGGGLMVTGDLNISIETPEPLESLDSEDIKNLIEDKFLPAFDELSRIGIKPR